MVVRDTDYASDAEVTTAIDNYLTNATADPNTSAVYLNRVKYDLDRRCEQEDFFLNTLHHQTTNGFQDTGADVDVPVYTISLDGSLTVGIVELIEGSAVAPGDTVVFAASDDAGSGALYTNGTSLFLNFYDNPLFSGTAVFGVTFSIANNTASGSFTIPASASGPLYGKATTSVVPYNQVSVQFDSNSSGQLAQTIYNVSNGDILGYYAANTSSSNSFTIALASGIDASDYTSTVVAREGNNSISLGVSINPTPTTFTFTPSAINGSIAAPIQINISTSAQ